MERLFLDSPLEYARESLAALSSSARADFEDLGLVLFPVFERDFDQTLKLVLFISMAVSLLASLLIYGGLRPAVRTDEELTTFRYSKDSKACRKVVESIQRHVGDYVPPDWYSPHIGTTVPLGSDLPMQYERHVVHESSTELVCVDWYPCKPKATHPSPHNKEGRRQIRVACVFPGLGLKSTSKFIKKFCHTIADVDEDMYVAVVLTRGVGCELKSARALWSPALTDDGERAIRYVHETHGKSAHIFLCGFSAGTNIVKTLLRSPKRRTFPVRGAFCVAASNCDYLVARTALEQTVSGQVYSRLIAGIYKDMVLSNTHVHAELPADTLRALRAVSCLSEYDEFAFEHLNQHLPSTKSREEYYQALSGGPGGLYCTRGVPLLVLQPADDPLHNGRVEQHLQPDELIRRNPRAIYMQTKHGNHFGYYEGCGIKTYTYPAKVAKVFINEVANE